MSKYKKNKWCFVPNCKNTTFKTPNKTFISVPKNLKMKQMWFKAVRRDFPTSASTFYCCEDHFNVQDDIENYLRYQMVGGYIKMKPGVVPHIFSCQTDRTSSISCGRKASSNRARTKFVEEILQLNIEENKVPEPPSEIVVNIPGQLLETVLQVLPEGDHNPYEDINSTWNSPEPKDLRKDVALSPRKSTTVRKKSPRKKTKCKTDSCSSFVNNDESPVSDCITSRESVTNNDEKGTEAVVYIWKDGQYRCT